jgi:hypothetical protein
VPGTVLPDGELRRVRVRGKSKRLNNNTARVDRGSRVPSAPRYYLHIVVSCRDTVGHRADRAMGLAEHRHE